MKNKIIIVLLASLFLIDSYQILDYKIHSIKIEQIFYEGSANRHEYVGYIEINNLNIKREIVIGFNDENLKNHVVLKEDCLNLESDNIVLAGHSIPSIFGNLHYIKINDLITIHTFNGVYYYKVEEIEIVYKTNVEILDDNNLILITCMDDNNKRLIVKAKKIE